jgi:hypothetical protein
MTPEELARAGRDPSAYYGDYDAIRRKVLAGELPEEMLSGRGATTIRPGTTNTRNFNPAAMYERFMNSIGGFTKNIDEPGGLLKNPEGNYRRSGGGKTGAAFGALETTLQDPVAGIISAPIGIGAGQLANMATTSLTQGMLQGPLPLKAAGMALRYLAPATVGYQAQQATARGVQQLTGSAPQAVAGAVASGGGGGGGGGGGLFGIGGGLENASFTLPVLGKINFGERAKSEAAAAYQRKERQRDFEASLAEQTRLRALNQTSDLAFVRESAQIANEAQTNQMKATFPLLLNMQREEANIQKTLLNLQAANMQSLARMAGGVQLMDRGMAEQGALSRTLAANSPYNSMVLPMPQIQFG